MTTAQLMEAAALAAMTAAAFGDADEVEQREDETTAVYVARMVHYGAMILEGK